MDLLIYEETIPRTGFCHVHVRLTGFDLEYTPAQVTTFLAQANAIVRTYQRRNSIKENLAPVVVQEASSSGTSEIPRWRRRQLEPQTWSFPSNMDPDARRALLKDKRISNKHLRDYFG
jgi:hypothetical protein